MVERIYAVCLKHARKCLPNDPALEAEDLVQAAWVKTAGKLDATRTPGEQVRYLRLAITQGAIDHARRLAHYPRERTREDAETDILAALLDPGDMAHEAEIGADLGAALARPGRGLTEATLLGLGFTIAEIAALLGIPTGTVKTNIHALRATRARDEGGQG